MNKTADVVIIGAGITGCAAAYYLAKKGVSVIVLESEMIGHGGSSRNGGGVRQSARDVRELPIAMYAIEHLWPNLSEELGCDIEYHKEGNLRLGKTPEHLEILKKLVDKSVNAGLDVRMIDGDEARQICPYMSHEVIGASWCPTDGHANPMVTTLAFYRRARAMGVHFISGEEVVELQKHHGMARKVITKAGNCYEGGHIIVAAGYASRAILNTVGIDVPLMKHNLECLVTEVQPPMFWQMLGTAEADFYGHQTNHGSFVFGGSSGLDAYVKNDNDAGEATSITAPSVCRGIMKYFPDLADAKIVRHWSGFMDDCADHVPIIDKVNEVPGLVIACGFTGHGFGIGPGTGLLLSQLVLDETPCVDVPGLRYDRFKAKA